MPDRFAAPPVVVTARVPLVMLTVYGPSSFHVPASPLATLDATVAPFRVREKVALLLSSQLYRLTLYDPDGMDVIVTLVPPAVAEPYTEHRIIVAVAVSVAGIRGTVWLQNRDGPDVRFAADVPASKGTPPTVTAAPFRFTARYTAAGSTAACAGAAKANGASSAISAAQRATRRSLPLLKKARLDDTHSPKRTHNPHRVDQSTQRNE